MPGKPGISIRRELNLPARETEGLLRQVSRSFYLTLRILPAAVRPQIGLAYLLARATDTVADTHLVPVERRLDALREMWAAIRTAASGHSAQIPDLGELAEARPLPAGHGSAAERALLESFSPALALLQGFSSGDREHIRDVLQTIVRGQEMDLVRFGSASEKQIAALQTDQEMEEYTYCVAGCAGEFWTKMCLAHILARAELDELRLLTDGVRFGKGLQLVNILRDLPRDLRQGRCYIPQDRLSEVGLRPEDLLDLNAFPRFRPLYTVYLTEAEELLAAGWDYTNALPRTQIRIRLACAWPILIGMKTLSRLRACNILDDRQRIKISRSEIRALVLRSLLAYPFPDTWHRLFARTNDGK